jgi:hypothetical protein
MRSATTRILLAFMLVDFALVGFWAALAPQSFYDDFPGLGRHWVSADGPFNEHLVRDVGTLNLALAAIALAALLRPGRYLVQAFAAASLIYAAPHFRYHMFHLDLFGTSDKVLEIVSLALTVIVPAVLLIATWRTVEPGAAASEERVAQDRGPAWR